jgi:hypothetical protein
MKRMVMIRFFSCLVAIAIGFSAPSALAGNKVLSLDGDGDCVRVSSSDSLKISGSFTLELWVLFRCFEDFDALILKGNPSPDWDYGLWRNPEKSLRVGFRTISGFQEFTSELSKSIQP